MSEGGPSIAALQSGMEGMSGGEGEEDSSLAVMNAVFHFVKAVDYSSHIGLGLDMAATAAFPSVPLGISFASTKGGGLFGIKLGAAKGGGDDGLGGGEGGEEMGHDGSEGMDRGHHVDDEFGHGGEVSHGSSDGGHAYHDSHEDDYPYANQQIASASSGFDSSMHYDGDVPDYHPLQPPMGTPAVDHGHDEGPSIH